MSEALITVYVTKNALTRGIQQLKARVISPGMIGVTNSGYTRYFHGNDWHRTREAAVIRAEAVRQKKLKSLEAQLTKLRNLTFA